jgi:hypothetical protein
MKTSEQIDDLYKGLADHINDKPEAFRVGFLCGLRWVSNAAEGVAEEAADDFDIELTDETVKESGG